MLTMISEMISDGKSTQQLGICSRAHLMSPHTYGPCVQSMCSAPHPMLLDARGPQNAELGFQDYLLGMDIDKILR